jgi:transposase
MTALAEKVDGVIGVDTHRDTLSAAAVTAVGGLLGQLAVGADAGLARLLAERGEWVVEVDRPRRPARRGGKTDALDAMRAAREALAQERPAVPRRRGDRQALRVLLATRQGAVIARTCAVNQLKALIVGAPEELRAKLRGRSTSGQVAYCAALRDQPARSLEHRTTVRALRSTAQRIRVLAAEAAELQGEIGRLVAAVAPWLLELPGIGPISASQVLVSWSHAGRYGRRRRLPPWPASARSPHRRGSSPAIG